MISRSLSSLVYFYFLHWYNCRLGPLPDTADYDVEASMEGYILTPVTDKKGFFKASKLGDITVKVMMF